MSITSIGRASELLIEIRAKEDDEYNHGEENRLRRVASEALLDQVVSLFQAHGMRASSAKDGVYKTFSKTWWFKPRRRSDFQVACTLDGKGFITAEMIGPIYKEAQGFAEFKPIWNPLENRWASTRFARPQDAPEGVLKRVNVVEDLVHAIINSESALEP